MTVVDRLLQGAIDMHVHHSPDHMPRLMDALGAARQAQQAGMRAIVLKNHSYPTAPLAIMASQLVPGVQVFGSLCLDWEVGGLNPHAVESSAGLGAKVVWMPTFSSSNSIGRAREVFGLALEGEGLAILDGNNRLAPEIGRILKLVKEHDMVLATGHLSPQETFALVEEARRAGVWKLVITHAFDAELVEQSLTLEDQERLAGMGAFIEYTCFGMMTFGRDPAPMAEAMKYVGPKHLIISSDLGQARNPPPVEGLKMLMASLLRNGFPEADIDIMVRVNPARLLGLHY